MSSAHRIRAVNKDMFKNFRDRIALSGVTVLMIGVTLLIFTFVSAYGFLAAGLSIIASEDLVRTFGEALAPLIATCIRVMYLGIMGWIGSLITIRGVTIIAHAPQTTSDVQPTQPVAEAKPQPQPTMQKPKAVEKPKTEKPKEEVKPSEPQFVVVPPEQISQTTPPLQQQRIEPEHTESSQQPAK
jgi:hypothetical protein